MKNLLHQIEVDKPIQILKGNQLEEDKEIEALEKSKPSTPTSPKTMNFLLLEPRKMEL